MVSELMVKHRFYPNPGMDRQKEKYENDSLEITERFNEVIRNHFRFGFVSGSDCFGRLWTENHIYYHIS